MHRVDRDRKGQVLNFHTQMCMWTLVYTCKKIAGIDGHKSMHAYTLTPKDLYVWSLHPFILTRLLSSHEKTKCKCPGWCSEIQLIQDWLQSSHLYAYYIPVAQMVEQYQCHGLSPKQNVRNYKNLYLGSKFAWMHMICSKINRYCGNELRFSSHKVLILGNVFLFNFSINLCQVVLFLSL